MLLYIGIYVGKFVKNAPICLTQYSVFRLKLNFIILLYENIKLYSGNPSGNKQTFFQQIILYLQH